MQPVANSVGYEARRGLRWLAAARGISAAFNLIATFLTIRLLAPEHFGLVAAATMLVGFIGLVNDAGLATSLVRTPVINDALIDRTQGLILLINVAAYLLLAALAPFAEGFFRFDGLAAIILVGGLQLLILGPIAAPSALLQRAMRFPVLASATVLEGVVGGICTVIMAWLGAGVWSLVVGPLIGSMSRGILVLQQTSRIPRPRPSLTGMSESLKFGGTLSAGHILWAAYSRADTIIVGRLLGNQALGVYSVAMQVATLPMEKIAGILNTVGLSTFASVQGEPDQLREKYLWVTRAAAGVVFPVFWGVSAVAFEITNVVLGPQWAAAALPLLLISLPVPLRFLSTLTEPVLLALGRADLSTRNVIAASCLMIPAFLIGSRWGLIGVSLAWPIGYSIFFVYRTVIALRAIGVAAGDYWRSIAPAIASAAIMYGAVALGRVGLEILTVPPWAALIALILVGVATYLAATWIMNRALLPDIRRLVG